MDQTFLRVISIAIILSAGLAIGVLLRDGPVQWLKLGAESVMYFALMLAVWSYLPLRRTFREAPRLYTIVLAAFLAMCVASQVIGSTGKTYPFTRWTLYSDRSRGSVIFDFKAVHLSGKQTNLLPVSGFLPPRTFNNTLQHLLETETGNSPHKSRWPHPLATSYRDICERVAVLNPSHREDPVVRIDAWRCRIKADKNQPENTVQRELVHQLDLSNLPRE